MSFRPTDWFSSCPSLLGRFWDRDAFAWLVNQYQTQTPHIWPTVLWDTFFYLQDCLSLYFHCMIRREEGLSFLRGNIGGLSALQPLVPVIGATWLLPTPCSFFLAFTEASNINSSIMEAWHCQGFHPLQWKQVALFLVAVTSIDLGTATLLEECPEARDLE